MSEISKQIPVIALRGITVLPGMLIHFDINRKSTSKAANKAMEGDQIAFLVTQKDPEVDIPTCKDLYSIGTIAKIKQIIKLPGDVLRVLVSGIERGELLELYEEETYLKGEVSTFTDNSLDELNEIEIQGMMRNLHELLKYYMEINVKINKAVVHQLLEIEHIEELVDQIAIHIPLELNDKQKILEATQVYDRYKQIAIILTKEIEILKVKIEFQKKVQEKVDKNQKEYLLREQMKVIREELGEDNTITDADNYIKQLEKLKADQPVKERIKKEIEHFKNISTSSAESAVTRGYIETLLSLPWNKVSKDNNDLKNAEKILDHDHYGMEKVKMRILEFLAVRTLTKKGDSPIICLVGPPGTGKTSIARSVATALKKEYIRISLGGVRDEAEIRGHRKTYVGAMPGRMVVSLKNAGVKNPLILLDEIDKVSSDYKGDTSSALLEVLDSEQNNKFIDHYVELPIDLSEVLFIATANTTQTIPKPLLDRMEIIEVNSYTQNEKIHIATKHLIEKQKSKNGIQEKQLSISPNALNTIIYGYTKEAGVRNLERKISEICRKVAREILEDGKQTIKVTERNLEKYLGKIKYTYDEANESDEVGIVRGLAWTSVGGDTLQIEVNVLPGKGNFELTGQLGNVMKESARAGISYIRSISDKYHIDSKFYETHDIHIHIPEGAVPKDGPSAGITMATAMISAIINRKVRADLAMTGEITLRGRVLPIGGLKEKIIAAKNAKIKLVLLPKKNKKNIEELSKEILDGIEIVFVDTMQEVLDYALV